MAKKKAQKKPERFSKGKVQRVLQSYLKRRQGKHNGATTDKKRKAVNTAMKEIAGELGITLDVSHLAYTQKEE